MEKKNFLKELFQPENKKTRMNLLTIFAVGVLLLLAGDTFFQKKETENKAPIQEQKEDTIQLQNGKEENLEKRLQKILLQVDGAGQVQVMITFRSGAESIVAQEEKVEDSHTEEKMSQGTIKTSENTKQENTVVMLEDGKGNKTPFVVKETVPQVEGVVIVAQGGEDARVRNALTLAAQALLDVPAHKIAILKMK
ncbi:MAG: hypothetical protein GX299_07690 [Epulopiscium sp.]|nr:hypothetical protein [Candidatus Epulonipiscium sp.]